jgi:hypothetical protein
MRPIWGRLLRLAVAAAVLTLGGCATMDVRNPVAGCKIQQNYLFDPINGHDDPLCLAHYVDKLGSDAAAGQTEGLPQKTASPPPSSAAAPPPNPAATSNVAAATTIVVTLGARAAQAESAAPPAKKGKKPQPGPSATPAALPTPFVLTNQQLLLRIESKQNQLSILIEPAAGGSGQERAAPKKEPDDAGALAAKRKHLLFAMYQTASSYCLYYKNRHVFAYKLGIDFANFGDVLVAAAVPIAAFSDATPDTIALISGLVTILGSPLKNALGGADPGQDYGQTLGGMKAVYTLFSSDDGFINGKDPGVSAKDMFQIYRTGLEQTCFSTLKFAGGKGDGN